MGLGLITGLFFGEMVGFLEVVGDVWIKLLQMTVLPYVMLSLVLGLGSLSYSDALLLAKKGGFRDPSRFDRLSVTMFGKFAPKVKCIQPGLN